MIVLTSHQTTAPRKIAIIGAGFSGTALAAVLHREASAPLEVYLFEKTGQFAAGDAYRTPFHYHYLNARAGDMSALEDEPGSFVEWLKNNANQYLVDDLPVARQFVPRVLYHQYLEDLLQKINADDGSNIQLILVPEEVVDIEPFATHTRVILHNQQTVEVDKVILALGNNPPARLPFKCDDSIHVINNPWDYTVLNDIPRDEPVLIIGTGLSMVDAVLSLHHQQHQGNITAVSRRGLLPLPHSDTCAAVPLDVSALPRDVRSMMKVLRAEANKITTAGGDWRGLMNAMRQQLPALWQRTSETCRKRFLRHVLPYWNIHRHRVQQKLHALLMEMCASGQLEVLAGRVQQAKDGAVSVRMRTTSEQRELPIKHIINCIGSGFEPTTDQPLIQALIRRDLIKLDPLRLGMHAGADCALQMPSGDYSSTYYVLGPPMRGEVWECVAVPEIRKQCKVLAKTLLHDA